MEKPLALYPDLATAYTLVQSFRTLLRERCAEELVHWLKAAKEGRLAPFQRLAKSLTSDYAAVLAGIPLPWSTGRVEGLITRVKLVKRSGYGRANLPLLRARIM